MIRKHYLEKRIAEAGLELKNLEREIGYNPFPSRPNVVLPQQPAMDTQSVAAGSEFTQATAVTDDKEEEKAASKEERKANEGPGTSNNIDNSFSTGFSTNSKPFVFNPNYNQAQQPLLPGTIDGKSKRSPLTMPAESIVPPLSNKATD